MTYRRRIVGGGVCCRCSARQSKDRTLTVNVVPLYGGKATTRNGACQTDRLVSGWEGIWSWCDDVMRTADADDNDERERKCASSWSCRRVVWRRGETASRNRRELKMYVSCVTPGGERRRREVRKCNFAVEVRQFLFVRKYSGVMRGQGSGVRPLWCVSGATKRFRGAGA
jgi:hypothetical protein